MRVYIQWATSTPQPWTPYDLDRIQDVRGLPRKPAPTGGESLDMQPGWLAAVDIQGVTFTGYDHMTFAVSGAGLLVYAWNDDPEDFPVGTRWGQVWFFDTLAPDARFGGAMNTRQTVTWYAEPGSIVVAHGIAARPWSELPKPAQNVTSHGVWMPDDLWAAHQALQVPHSWEEWAP